MGNGVTDGPMYCTLREVERWAEREREREGLGRVNSE